VLLICCQPLVIIDATSFNVAVATIGRTFALDAGSAGSLNLGYAVALAVMIPLSGWLGERHGTIRTLIAGLIVVALGSLLGFFADSPGQVMVARVVQGIGSGGLIPLSMALVFRHVTPSERLRVLGMVALPVSLAPAIGPALGGLLVDLTGWRSVFLLSIPWVVVAVVVALTWAAESSARSGRRLDVRGLVLTTLGLSLLVLGAQRLASGESVIGGVVALAIGVTSLAFLIPFQWRRGGDAFVNLRLFRHATYARASAILAVHSAGFLAFALAAPLLLQTTFGVGASEAGLVSVVAAAGPLVMSRSTPRLITRVGSRFSIVGSQLLTVIGLSAVIAGFLSHLLWTVIIGCLLAGVASLLTVMTCQCVGFAELPARELGDATALDGTARQVGGAIGMTALTAALTMTAPYEGAASVLLPLGTIAAFHAIALIIGFRLTSLPGRPRSAGLLR